MERSRGLALTLSSNNLELNKTPRDLELNLRVGLGLGLMKAKKGSEPGSCSGTWYTLHLPITHISVCHQGNIRWERGRNKVRGEIEKVGWRAEWPLQGTPH